MAYFFLFTSHHAMTVALDGDLYKAPLTKDPKNALDIGTGTGKPACYTALEEISQKWGSLGTNAAYRIVGNRFR